MRSCLRNVVAVLFLGLSLLPPMFFMIVPNFSFLVDLKFTILMAARVVFFAMVREIEANSGSLEFDAFGLLFLMFTEASKTTEATKKVNRHSGGLGAQSTRDTPVRKSRTKEKVAAMLELYRDELRFIKQGSYDFPAELEMSVSSLFTLCALVVESFFEFPRMDRRRRGGGDSDALIARKYKACETHLKLPDYYLQHFHHQSDGWLSSASARRWEFQVETRFIGSAGTMRRRALPHIKKFMMGRDARETSVLDVASGTGQFLHFVRENFPDLMCTSVELSPYYLEAVRDVHKVFSNSGSLRLVNANAESLPFGKEEFDMVTNVYLFHELPAYARVNVAKEICRVLKPGGIFVFVDSAQLGDAKARGGYYEDALTHSLNGFSENHHEPYHKEYINQDMVELFHKETNLRHETTSVAFVSKVMIFSKPAS
jgi:ubiquinone/menaquinone biosynthesis C-methylase UbiE